jgi:hypothetical protein
MQPQQCGQSAFHEVHVNDSSNMKSALLTLHLHEIETYALFCIDFLFIPVLFFCGL